MTNEADKPGIRGFFKRLRAKLNQGPAWLTTDITELLPGRKIDAEILDDLETRLITADVGTEATGRILDELRTERAQAEVDRRRTLSAFADSLSGDLCVDGTIAAYLESGKLPKRNPNAKWDKTCAPLPPPVPSGGGTQKAAREPPTFEGNRLATVAGDMP